MSFFVIFSVGPHNLEFLAKKSLEFFAEGQKLEFFGLEFFAKCTKNKPELVAPSDSPEKTETKVLLETALKYY